MPSVVEIFGLRVHIVLVRLIDGVCVSVNLQASAQHEEKNTAISHLIAGGYHCVDSV